MKQYELHLLFALTSLVVFNAAYKPTSDWPVVVFKEGETAHLPCPPHGHANAFFWRKGELFNVSRNIASIVHGIPDTSEKYNVLDDGTLVITYMSPEDQGKYFCRIASEKNECHGSITVYLEVTAEVLEISIEGCNATSSCIKFLRPFLNFKLTCSANIVSESMTLNWYNGTKEITGNVDIFQSSGQAMKITNVITVHFHGDSQLTCEVDGVNIPRHVAVVQLKELPEVSLIGEDVKASPSIVPIMVLGILCVILGCLWISFMVLYFRKRKSTTYIMTATSQEESGKEKSENHGQLEEPTQNLKEEEIFMKTTTTGLDEKEEEIKLLQSASHETETNKEAQSQQKLLQSASHETETNMEAQSQQKALQTQPKGMEDKLTLSLEETQTLQTQLKEIGEKMKKSEGEKQTLQTQLKEIGEKMKKSEGEKQTLQTQLKEIGEKMKKSEGEKQTLQTQLKEMGEKMKKSEGEKQTLQTQLKEIGEKMKKSEGEKQTFQTKLKEIGEKMKKSEEEKQKIVSEIVERNRKRLRKPSKPNVRAIIALKNEERHKTNSIEAELPKSKYHNVAYLSGQSYQTGLFQKVKDTVNNIFDGEDSCIIVFGDHDSDLAYTLHNGNKSEGLIGNVTDHLFWVCKQLPKGFQVEIQANIFKTVTEDKMTKFRSPTDQAFEECQITINDGAKLTINNYNVKSAETLKHLASFLAPKGSNDTGQGFFRIKVETLVGNVQVSLGSLTIASITNVGKTTKIFTEKQKSLFERLLSSLASAHDANITLVTLIDVNEQGEPRKTCAAMKLILDTYR